MTNEQLKKGNELKEEIQRLETFCEAFHGPCTKGLVSYVVGKREAVTLGIERDSELYKIIDGYLMRKLEEIKNDFNEI